MEKISALQFYGMVEKPPDIAQLPAPVPALAPKTDTETATGSEQELTEDEPKPPDIAQLPAPVPALAPMTDTETATGLEQELTEDEPKPPSNLPLLEGSPTTHTEMAATEKSESTKTERKGSESAALVPRGSPTKDTEMATTAVPKPTETEQKPPNIAGLLAPVTNDPPSETSELIGSTKPKPPDTFQGPTTTVAAVSTLSAANNLLPDTMHPDEYMVAYKRMKENEPTDKEFTVGSVVDYCNEGHVWTTTIATKSEDESGNTVFYGEWPNPKDKWFRTVSMFPFELLHHVSRDSLELPDLSSLPRKETRVRIIDRAATLKSGEIVVTVDGKTHTVSQNYHDLKVLVSEDGDYFSYLKLANPPKPLPKVEPRTRKRMLPRGSSPCNSEISSASVPVTKGDNSKRQLAKCSKQIQTENEPPQKRKVRKGTPWISRRKIYNRWLIRSRKVFRKSIVDDVTAVVTQLVSDGTAKVSEVVAAAGVQCKGSIDDVTEEFGTLRTVLEGLKSEQPKVPQWDTKLDNLLSHVKAIGAAPTAVVDEAPRSKCLSCTRVIPIGDCMHTLSPSLDGHALTVKQDVLLGSASKVKEDSPPLYDETTLIDYDDSESPPGAYGGSPLVFESNVNKAMAERMLLGLPITPVAHEETVFDEPIKTVPLVNFFQCPVITPSAPTTTTARQHSSDGGEIQLLAYPQTPQMPPKRQTAAVANLNKTHFDFTESDDTEQEAKTDDTEHGYSRSRKEGGTTKRDTGPPLAVPHELISDWTATMVHKQPHLQIRQWSDYHQVRFTGEVLLDGNLHAAAMTASTQAGKLVTESFARRHRKGTLALDKNEQRKRTIFAKWLGYVDGVIKCTTGLDWKTTAFSIGDENEQVSTDMKRLKLTSTKQLIQQQPKPLSTALQLCWANVFEVDKRNDEDSSLHDGAVKYVIKQLQGRARQKKRRLRERMADTSSCSSQDDLSSLNGDGEDENGAEV